MENSIKALLIAAAILIVMLIISLGIYVFNISNQVDNSANLNEYDVQAFNNKFSIYEGTNKSSSQVLALLTTISNNNAVNTPKVAVKLSGMPSVYDSCRFAILDENNTLIKCNSGNVVSLDDIIAVVKRFKTYDYTVTSYYCNSNSQAIGNNTHLNPSVGCILLIHISKQ